MSDPVPTSYNPRYGPLPPQSAIHLGRAEFLGESRLESFLALTLLVGSFALLTYWGISEGAFFGRSFYPGALVIYALVALVLWSAPLRIRSSRLVGTALAALAALGAWTVISMLWSPAPDQALADGQIVIAYAALLGLGVALGHLLFRKLTLALVPVAAAGLVVGMITVITIWGGSDAEEFFTYAEGRFDFPLAYYNANAAFFAITAWAGLGLVAARDRDWTLRTLGFAAMTLGTSLAVLSMSRGWLVASLVAAVVWLVLAQERGRAAGYLLVAGLPVAAVLPLLTDPFQDAINDRDAISSLQTAAVAAVAATGVSVAVGAVLIRVERRLRPPAISVPRVVTRGLVAVIAIAGLVAIISADPVDWIDDRLQQAREGGTPTGDELDSGRLNFNARSNRADFWRVALDDFADAPIGGTGAGGFEYSYLRNRNSGETPRDAHGVGFETLGELGIIGLALLAAVLLAAIIAIIRARRSGPSASVMGLTALTALAYWGVHASVDWFWTYPGVTAPMLLIVGAACAPVVRGAAPVGARAWRIGGIIAATLLALSTVPLYVSERLTRAASVDADTTRALDRLDTAADLNPWADAPLLLSAQIARLEDLPGRALTALERARERKPAEWAAPFLEACVLRDSDPDAAARALAEARRLFPDGERIAALRDQLGERRPGGPRELATDPCLTDADA